MSTTRSGPLPKAVVACFGAVLLTFLSATPAGAHDSDGDTPSATRGLQVAEVGAGRAMSWVANIQYVPPAPDSTEPVAQTGSDIEFLKAGGREYALAGTTDFGLHIIDITKPTAPVRAATYDCPIYQGDVQVWKKNKRVYASYTADTAFGAAGAASRCGRDLAPTFAKLGIAADKAIGTVIVDVTDPRVPKTVSFLHIPRGSHNMTIHPSGNYLYNSNSDLATSTDPTIEVWNVADPAAPAKVHTLHLPYTPTSLGSESHDITFNTDGTRAYSAAISQTLVLDTANPAQPKILSKIVDPTVNVSHQADPVTVTRADGTKREVLIVTDERAGALGTFECPGGGLHLYDVTGSNELAPVKMGAWFIDKINAPESRCTSHVLRIYPAQKLLTIAWYGQGVRVLDISGIADHAGLGTDVAFGEGVGMKEIGNFVMPDADTWSFKTNKINKDGSFYGYGNDLTRGFDVYRYDGSTIGDVPPLAPRSLLDTELPDAGLPGTGVQDARTGLSSLHLGVAVLPLALVGLCRRGRLVASFRACRGGR
ncbi:LVIVD repeat-containing protein [Actinokineospora xionganensis]|uniref:LVIVD repeat-containing protein n=1 Tax=Actinokineospora xionganensis TaxID=2684470 RepID=A0ABR7LFW7_9PSEU|nr:hypothetical protein [Actinokineospora xionganensis]MBC6451177.1 hypothetical protein [Actinokineospora xionganensis]